MYDSDINPKMGILVINLPTISNKQGMIACGNDEEQVMGNVLTTWTPIQKDVTYIENNYPYLPNRIVTNLARNNVRISVVNWNVIENDYEKLKYLIDNAFNRRKTNDYDHSEPLRRRNS
jgi:conjugal transfer/entry exclusion protein